MAVNKRFFCEVCGKRMERPKQRPVCVDCQAVMSHSLAAERRKRRLDRCGHPAFDLGESEAGARVEYHIRGGELAEVARCRAECGLPAVWNGRKWVKGGGESGVRSLESGVTEEEEERGDEGLNAETQRLQRGAESIVIPGRDGHPPSFGTLIYPTINARGEQDGEETS